MSEYWEMILISFTIALFKAEKVIIFTCYVLKTYGKYLLYLDDKAESALPKFESPKDTF